MSDYKSKLKRIANEESKNKKPAAANEEDENESVIEKPPERLLCIICNEILEQAVITKCCGHVFCDECIRNWLLETKICPHCEKHNSPGDLYPCSNTRKVGFIKICFSL